MSSTSSSSQYIYPPPSPSPSSDPDSLPDSAPSDDTTSTSDDEGESDAEKEWKESLQQLELILTMVLVPYAGKYFGRKCAYWGGCAVPLFSCALPFRSITRRKVVERKGKGREGKEADE